jgi:hypothetical protein
LWGDGDREEIKSGVTGFLKSFLNRCLLQCSICGKSGLGFENNPERGPDSQRDDELLQGLVVLLQVSVTRRPANNPIAKTTF